MRSKAAIGGHPLHPMLIAFPVAFYVATLVGYAIYASTADTFWFHLAFYANVAGVATAVLAALPGFIDWAKAIPNRTRAKRDGTVHMLLNLTVLALFAVNLALQRPQLGEERPEYLVALLLSGLGVLLTLGAGWMGWRLVQTHHVGVILTPEQERYEPVSDVHDPSHRARPTYRPGPLPPEEADAL